MFPGTTLKIPFLVIWITSTSYHFSLQITLLDSGEGSTSDSGGSVPQHAQVALQAIQNQPGLALADLAGQQIFVVTDPSQLEMIQVSYLWSLTRDLLD